MKSASERRRMRGEGRGVMAPVICIYKCTIVCLPLSLIPVAGCLANTDPELFGGLLSDGAGRVCGVQAGPPGLHLAGGPHTQPLQVRGRAGVHAHTYTLWAIRVDSRPHTLTSTACAKQHM